MGYGQNLRRARKRARLTLDDIAEELGVSPQAVSQWELEKDKPELLRIPDIAKAYKTSPNQIFDYRDRLDPIDQALLDALGAVMPQRKKDALRALKAFLLDTD